MLTIASFQSQLYSPTLVAEFVSCRHGAEFRYGRMESHLVRFSVSIVVMEQFIRILHKQARQFLPLFELLLVEDFPQPIERVGRISVYLGKVNVFLCRCNRSRGDGGFRRGMYVLLYTRQYIRRQEDFRLIPSVP